MRAVGGPAKRPLSQVKKARPTLRWGTEHLGNHLLGKWPKSATALSTCLESKGQDCGWGAGRGQQSQGGICEDGRRLKKRDPEGS